MHVVSDCIFCKIVAADAPCHRVVEDDLTITFLDLFPVTDGHTLVVTREHFENIFEVTPEALAAVARTSHQVASAIKAEVAPDGLGVFQLNGAAAGQTVFHYHMHLIPRMQGDALQIHSRTQGDPEQLAVTARKLAAAIDSH